MTNPQLSGTCSNCGHGSFTLALGKKKLASQLLRCCKKCLQIENTEDNRVLREGKTQDGFIESEGY